MCCQGSQIPYKDYTPQDQLGLRQAYNLKARSGLQKGATGYNPQAAFAPQMNPLQLMAAQAMFGLGGGQGQMQMPGFLSFQDAQRQYSPGMPYNPTPSPAAGGGGQYGGGAGQGGNSVPYWMMMANLMPNTASQPLSVGRYGGGEQKG